MNFISILLLLLFALLSGCVSTANVETNSPDSIAPSDSISYVVTILSTDDNPLEMASSYATQVVDVQSKHGGKFASGPILVQKQLANPWLPKTTTNFPGDVVLFEVFLGMDSVERYLDELDDFFALWDKASGTPIRFVGAVAPNPGATPFPVIGSVPFRKNESFILLNAASFLPPPERGPLIKQYFDIAGPIVSSSGARFLATIANVRAITGVFPHQVLFLSEWASEDAFNKVHRNNDWQAVAPYRNEALTSFTEAKGIVSTVQ